MAGVCIFGLDLGDGGGFGLPQPSVIVTTLLGSSPVLVLATHFLLSYAKALRTIIFLTILHYPHKNIIVWMQMCPYQCTSGAGSTFSLPSNTLLLLLGQ